MSWKRTTDSQPSIELHGQEILVVFATPVNQRSVSFWRCDLTEWPPSESITHWMEVPALPDNSGECRHQWVANSGRGGEPDFRANRQVTWQPTMHVKCSVCNTRTWLTRKQWVDFEKRSSADGEKNG